MCGEMLNPRPSSRACVSASMAGEPHTITPVERWIQRRQVQIAAEAARVEECGQAAVVRVRLARNRRVIVQFVSHQIP